MSQNVEIKYKIETSGTEELKRLNQAQETVAENTEKANKTLKDNEQAMKGAASGADKAWEEFEKLVDAQERLDEVMKKSSATARKLGEDLLRTPPPQRPQAPPSLPKSPATTPAEKNPLLAIIRPFQQSAGAGAFTAVQAVQNPFTFASNAALNFAGSLGTVGIATAGAVAGIALISAKLIGLVKDEAEAARATENTASRLGLTAAATQQLSAAAQLAGVNFGTVESGARLLAAALEDPTGQGKKAAKVLADLGIATLDFTGGSREMGAVLADLLSKLSEIKDPAERLVLLNRTLGRGGKELVPLVADYERLRQVVSDLGIGDNAAVQKLSAVDEQFKALDLSWQKLKQDFAATLTPEIKFVLGIARGAAGDKGADLSIFQQAAGASLLGGLGPLGAPLAALRAIAGQGGPPAAAAPATGVEAKSSLIAHLKTLDTEAEKKRASSVAKQFLGGISDTVEDLNEQLAEAKQRVKKSKNELQSIASTPQTGVDAENKAEQEYKSSSADVARIEARLKALKPGSQNREARVENRYKAELDRIKAEENLYNYPSSDYGRLAQLQNQYKSSTDGYENSLDYSRSQKEDLKARAKHRYDRDAAIEAQKIGEQSAFENARTKTDESLDLKQTQFQQAQRLASITSQGDETPAKVEAAYQKQVQLAAEISAAHRQDLELLHSAANAAEKTKQEQEIQKTLAKEIATADGERIIALAEIEKKTQETAKTLASIKRGSDVEGLQRSFGVQQRLAEINGNGEKGSTQVQAGLKAQLEIARAIYAQRVADNAAALTGGDLEIANARELAELEKQTDEAHIDAALKVLELGKQARDQAREAAGSIYEALRSPSGAAKGISDLFKGQLDKVGENLFKNVTQGAIGQIQKTIGNALPKDGIFKDVLKGTIFDSVDVTKEQLDTQRQILAAVLAIGGKGKLPSVPGLPGLPSPQGGLTGTPPFLNPKNQKTQPNGSLTSGSSDAGLTTDGLSSDANTAAVEANTTAINQLSGMFNGSVPVHGAGIVNNLLGDSSAASAGSNGEPSSSSSSSSPGGFLATLISGPAAVGSAVVKSLVGGTSSAATSGLSGLTSALGAVAKKANLPDSAGRASSAATSGLSGLISALGAVAKKANQPDSVGATTPPFFANSSQNYTGLAHDQYGFAIRPDSVGATPPFFADSNPGPDFASNTTYYSRQNYTGLAHDQYGFAIRPDSVEATTPPFLADFNSTFSTPPFGGGTGIGTGINLGSYDSAGINNDVGGAAAGLDAIGGFASSLLGSIGGEGGGDSGGSVSSLLGSIGSEGGEGGIDLGAFDRAGINDNLGASGGSSSGSSSSAPHVQISTSGGNSSDSAAGPSLGSSLLGIAGGGFQAYKGFKQGGNRGIASGVGGSLEAAGAIADLIPGGAIVGGVLQIAGMVSTLVSSFFGDPRQQRQKELTQEEQADKIAGFKYTASPLDINESTNGLVAGDDFRGNYRQTASRPTVYSVNTPVGFDALHSDRIITQAMREQGQTPASLSDLGGFYDAAQPLNRSYMQEVHDAPKQNVTYQFHMPVSAMDSQDIIRRGPDIATAVSKQLLGTHRLGSDIKNLVAPV